MASSSNHLFSSLTRFCFWSCQYQNRSKPNSNTLMLKPPLLARLFAQLPPLHCSLHFIWNSSPLVPLLPLTHSSLPWVPVLLIQHSCQYTHVPATVLHLAIPGMLTLPFPTCLFSPACQDEPSSLPHPHSPEAEGHESHDRGESLFYTVTFTNHTAHISGNTCTSAQLTFLLSTTTSLKRLHFPQTAKTHPNPLSADDLVSLHKKTLSH